MLTKGWSAAKLADFGLRLARSLHTEENFDQGPEPPWIAPEIIMQNENPSKASDIFSFGAWPPQAPPASRSRPYAGMLMYEVMLHGEPPRRILWQDLRFDPAQYEKSLPDDLPKGYWPLLCDCVCPPLHFIHPAPHTPVSGKASTA